MFAQIIGNVVVPFPIVALYIPTVYVNVEFRSEKRKLLGDTTDKDIIGVKIEFGAESKKLLL